ncbi:small GTPase [Perkinsus sp. BL_2016]|nr:small GTPase [Perkinsus sp. BL_2016]
MILLFSNQFNQSFRPYWRCYYANTDAIVYVIDSADKDRINTAKAELSSMLQEDELKNTLLLILANKQDLPDALSPTTISEILQLTEIKNRSWSIQKTSALTGEGLDQGFDW